MAGLRRLASLTATMMLVAGGLVGVTAGAAQGAGTGDFAILCS